MIERDCGETRERSIKVTRSVTKRDGKWESEGYRKSERKRKSALCLEYGWVIIKAHNCNGINWCVLNIVWFFIEKSAYIPLE